MGVVVVVGRGLGGGRAGSRGTRPCPHPSRWAFPGVDEQSESSEESEEEKPAAAQEEDKEEEEEKKAATPQEKKRRKGGPARSVLAARVSAGARLCPPS